MSGEVFEKCVKLHNRAKGRDPREGMEVSMDKQFTKKVDKALKKLGWIHMPWGLVHHEYFRIFSSLFYAQLHWDVLRSKAKSACVWFERGHSCNLEAVTMTQHAERGSVLGKLGYTEARFWEGNQEVDDSH